MKHNTQILSFQSIEPDHLHREIHVAYTLEGEPKHLSIPFEHIMTFMQKHREKVESYNDALGLVSVEICIWPDETIRETAEAYIRNYERFDLIIENRKLRDANMELESKLSRIKVKSIIFMPLFEGIIKNYNRISEMGFLKYLLPKYYISAGSESCARASIEILKSIKEVCDGK